MDEADNGKSFAENFGSSVRKRARDAEGIEAQAKELNEKLLSCIEVLELSVCDTCGLVIKSEKEGNPPGRVPCKCGHPQCKRLICCGLHGCRAEWERVRLCSGCGCHLSSDCEQSWRCGEYYKDDFYCDKVFCDSCFSKPGPGRGLCTGGNEFYCLEHLKSVQFKDEDHRQLGSPDVVQDWLGSPKTYPLDDVDWKPVVPSEMRALTLQIQKAALMHIAAKKRATLHFDHLQSVESELIKEGSIQKCPRCEAYVTNDWCDRCSVNFE